MTESSTDERVQIQQQLYNRFCRLCRGPLSLERYDLYRAWSLTMEGTAVDRGIASPSVTLVEIRLLLRNL